MMINPGRTWRSPGRVSDGDLRNNHGKIINLHGAHVSRSLIRATTEDWFK